MLSLSFTKAEIQINQLTHKQLPSRIDFAILQDRTLKPVHYLIKHEEVLPNQNHDSNPILADYGTDQFSLRINDKGNDIFVKPINSFSFKSVSPFQTRFKTPVKKNNKTLHQQSVLLNDTDNTSDEDTYSTINKSKSTTIQESTSAINVQTNSQPITHCSQIILFYDTSFFKYKIVFKVSLLLMTTR